MGSFDCFRSMCRLCGVESPNLIHIVETARTGKTLLNMINIYLRLVVSGDDLLPRQVCGPCLAKLDEVVDFVDATHATQTRLITILADNSKYRKSNVQERDDIKVEDEAFSVQFEDDLNDTDYEPQGARKRRKRTSTGRGAMAKDEDKRVRARAAKTDDQVVVVKKEEAAQRITLQASEQSGSDGPEDTQTGGEDAATPEYKMEAEILSKHHGHIYVIGGIRHTLVRKLNPTTLYLKCLAPECKGRAKIHQGFAHFYTAHTAPHPGEDMQVRILRLQASMREDALTTCDTISQIISNRSLEDPEAAAHIAVVKMRNTLVKFRKRSSPPNPQSLAECLYSEPDVVDSGRGQTIVEGGDAGLT